MTCIFCRFTYLDSRYFVRINICADCFEKNIKYSNIFLRNEYFRFDIQNLILRK